MSLNKPWSLGLVCVDPLSSRKLSAPEPLNTLKNIAGGELNLLPVSQQSVGVLVRVPLWVNSAKKGEVDYIVFYIDRKMANGQRIYGPAAEEFPESFLVTGKEFLESGKKEITYSVINNDGNSAGSEALIVSVDTTDPNLGKVPLPVILPDDLEGKVITQQYLDSHQQHLEVVVPGADDFQSGDLWELYWGEEESPVLTGSVSASGMFEIRISGQIIAEKGDGEKALYYRIVDRSGNATKYSIKDHVIVSLMPVPAGLKKPVVGSDSISRYDVLEGLSVTIEEYQGFSENNVIVAYWGGVELPSIALSNDCEFPIVIPVDWETVSFHGSDEPYTAIVEYFVYHGGGYVKSPSEQVSVNLVVPGPSNSDIGPVNHSLEKPRAKGTSSGVENALLPEDKNQSMNVTFSLYEPYQVGEEITLHYGFSGEVVDSYTIDGFEGDGYIVELSVPWSIINSIGDGRIELFYRVSNTNNFQQSPSAIVNVSIFGADNVQPAFFPIRDVENNIIRCEHKPWEGVPVQIYDPDNLSIGDRIVLHWVMHNHRTDGVPVEVTRGLFPRSIQPSDVADGVIFIVPFTPYIEPVVDGSIRVFWEVTKLQDGSKAQSEFTCVKYTRKTAGAPCMGQ